MYFPVPDPDLEIRGGLSSRRLDKGGGLQKVFSGLGDLLFRRFLYPAQQTSKGEGKRGKRERGLAPPFFAPATQAIDFEMLPSFSRPSKKRMRPWNEVSVFTWPVIKRNHTHTHIPSMHKEGEVMKNLNLEHSKKFFIPFLKNSLTPLMRLCLLASTSVSSANYR